LGTPLLLLAHFLPFGHCATSNAAHDSARESAMTGRMTCDTANKCALDAAFGIGESGRKRDCERQDNATNNRFHRPNSIFY
jgi:hypothetical protein